MRREEVARELRRIGVRASRSLGQNFLVDERVAHRHAELAEIRSDETVLEVGPGLGILTRLLASRARRVVAIERDRRLAGALGDLENVEVIRGDALAVDWPEFDAMVSNLPYRISSPLVFRLLDRRFDRAVLMFQKEFADRLVARPGTKDYSRLTVHVAHRAEAVRLAEVPRAAFHPAPRVDSAIVRLTPRTPPYRVEDEVVFRQVVDACFAHRRKTIGNALALATRAVGIDPDALREVLSATSVADRRPESLAPEDFANLTNALARAKG